LKKIILLILILTPAVLFAQEEEPVLYYQMEPLDDSLFILIQEELFIDPPDPKAEIIVDLRDQANQTISIKGALYPFLALSPETRARIVTYPFKLNLEETIGFESVFVRVINRLRFDKILTPPTVFQISPTLGYINPYLQMMGGERFGIPIKKDIGLSFGLGTPYSGTLETNFTEINFHILGFKGGIFTGVDAMTELKSENNQNNIFVTEGVQFSYTIPFGNFFEIGYFASTDDFTEDEISRFTELGKNRGNIVYNSDGTIRYQPYLVDGSFVNFELRYPVKLFGSARSRFYTAHYIDEWHIGFEGRELTLAGSVFDFRFNAMVSSPARPASYAVDLSIQKIFDYWAFSAVSMGPSFIISDSKSGSTAFTSFFINIRIKVGTAL
jgi:hypothetical protein